MLTTHTLMADYVTFGWEHRGPADEQNPPLGGGTWDSYWSEEDPVIDRALQDDLKAWHARFEAGNLQDPESALAFDWCQFHKDGIELCRRLKAAFGPDVRIRYEKPIEDPDARWGRHIFELADNGSVIPISGHELCKDMSKAVVTRTLMADFTCFGWVHRGPADEENAALGGGTWTSWFGAVRDGEIDAPLWQDMLAWHDRFEAADLSDRDNASRFDWESFHAEGIELCKRLKQPYGPSIRIRYEKPAEDPQAGDGREIVEIGEDGSVTPVPWDEAVARSRLRAEVLDLWGIDIDEDMQGAR